MKPAAKTRTIAAGEFKAKCLSLMNDLPSSGSIAITKRGKVVAELNPPSKKNGKFRSIFGRSRAIEIEGDIISPLPQELTLPEELWD
ncbi:hypothetical protein [Terriglobus saanensis]|nr:hypothetical protein [Terriglobus saanensis]